MTATTRGRGNARQAEWLQCIMSGPGAKLRMGVAIAEVTKPVTESQSRKFSMTPLLLLVAPERRAALVARPCTQTGEQAYEFNIVLQGNGETPFFNV